MEYSIHHKILSGPEFQPNFDDYEANIKHILSQQQGKPRYLPDKDQFLKYADITYFEPQEPYERLKKYILRHKLSPNGEGLEGVDGELLDLREMIQEGVKVQDYIEYFEESGYQFNTMDKLNNFLQEVMNVHNNTRLYDNKGFTPNGLRPAMEDGDLLPLPTPLVQKKSAKIGRNELCPCGSGLKYKNCHGKNLLH